MKERSISANCYVKNLYELFDNENNFIDRNYLEDCFGQLETDFPKFKKQLEQKANKENEKTSSFLTKEEKAFWSLFTFIQLLRTEKTLSIAKATIDELDLNITDKEKENLKLKWTFPFYKETEKNNAIVGLFHLFSDICFAVLLDEDGKNITTDNPVCFLNQGEQRMIIFPISPKLCLVLSNGCGYKKNVIGTVCDKDREFLLSNIVRNANKYIFSNYELSNHEIEMIKMVLDVDDKTDCSMLFEKR